MKKLKDFASPQKAKQRADMLAFLTVLTLLTGTLLILYHLVGFEESVLVALALLIVSVANG
jgi:hypothetical protein